MPRKLENRILVNVELATQPGVPEDERSRLLHFVVVVVVDPQGWNLVLSFMTSLNRSVSV